jgi:hypothetical protein
MDVLSSLPSCNSTQWICKAAQRLRSLARRIFALRNGCAHLHNGFLASATVAHATQTIFQVAQRLRRLLSGCGDCAAAPQPPQPIHHLRSGAAGPGLKI